MHKIILIFSLVFLWSIAAEAQMETPEGYQENSSLQEYFDASDNDYDKSIIYVFFNNEPCYGCAQAISMIEQVYDQNFINQYNMFLINYENDQENNFIETYNLSQPLEVVLVRINDGAAFGYKKLENLQNMISDPVSFDDYLSEQINSFLGN